MLTFIKLTGIKGENVLINTNEISSIREITHKFDEGLEVTSSKIYFLDGSSLEVQEIIDAVTEIIKDICTIIE